VCVSASVSENRHLQVTGYLEIIGSFCKKLTYQCAVTWGMVNRRNQHMCLKSYFAASGALLMPSSLPSDAQMSTHCCMNIQQAGDHVAVNRSAAHKRWPWQTGNARLPARSSSICVRAFGTADSVTDRGGPGHAIIL